MSDLLIRFLILLAIFASVFLISQVLLAVAWQNRSRFAAINKRLTMIRQGAQREEVIARLRKNASEDFEGLPAPIGEMARTLQRMLFAAAVPWTLGQALIGLLLGFAIVLGVLILLVSLTNFAITIGTIVLLATLAAGISIGLPLIFINMRAQKRRKRMEEQFPVALDVFVRALRSGHPVASAIGLVTEEMEDPIGSEFGLVSDEISYGLELTDSLDAMAERWDLDDIRMFVVSLSVQSETGGNLAEVLENLSDVIRARHSLFMKVRALSSEGRMTALILTALPVVTFIGMFLVNPGFYIDVSGDPIFIVGFIGLTLLFFGGIYWIRKLVDIKV